MKTFLLFFGLLINGPYIYRVLETLNLETMQFNKRNPVISTTIKNTKFGDMKYDEDSILSKMERNDCVVTAIATVFNLKYDVAHAYVKDIFKRADKQGTYGARLKMRGLTEAFGRKIIELGIKDPNNEYAKDKLMVWPWKDKGEIKYAKYTVGKFLAEHPEGDYLMYVSGHAFAIKDGVIFGNKQDALKLKVRVEQAFHVLK